jgi:PAS domain S-box-containing protein
MPNPPRIVRFSTLAGIPALLALAAQSLLWPWTKTEQRYLLSAAIFIACGVAISLFHERYRRRKHRYTSLFEQAPDGIFLADLQGRYTEVNPAACQMLGYSRSELIGMSITDVIFPADRARFKEAREVRLLGHADMSCWQLRRKDGSVVETEIHAQILPGGIWQAYVRDITERKKIESELIDSRNRLRDMVLHHEIACEEDRKHLSAEIHDELGQILTGLRMDVSLLKTHRHDEPQLDETLDDMSELIDGAFSVARKVVTSLRPAVLNMGLIAALEWLAQDFSRRMGLPCTLTTDLTHLPLRESQSAAIFRIAQESLTNVARHAQARQAHIVLSVQGQLLSLSVQDDGQGFEQAPQEQGHGYGLLSMQERVLSLGGHFDVQTTRHQGTTVRITVPI